MNLCVIFLWARALVTDTKSEKLMFAVIYLTLPTLCLTASYFATKLKLKFAELHGPILYASYGAIRIVTNTTQVLKFDEEIIA